MARGGGAKRSRHRFTRATHSTSQLCAKRGPNLLISGDASVDGGVDDAVEAHAERVDVAVVLPVLVLADQSPQLLGLILHHVDGVLQGAHLHLQANTRTM